MNNRDKVIQRVQRELIGTGSDLFECSDKANFSDEIISDKPLLRYFSAILYPKQTTIDNFGEDDDSNDATPIDITEIVEKSNIDKEDNDNSSEIRLKEDDKNVQYSASTFFPSQYGISFAISKECQNLRVIISFGNYKEAKAKEIALSYDGDSVELLEQFGLQQFVEYDAENRLLKQSKELTKAEKQLRSDCLNALGVDHRDSILYKTLRKLFFKDKYKRFDNLIETTLSISALQQAENHHYKILLSEIEGVNCDNWYQQKNTQGEVIKDLRKDLWLHAKLYEQQGNYIVKIFIENTLLFKRTNFSIAKEALNQACLFQTEIKVETPFLEPFKGYKNNLFKSDEDRMLDFLYREKLSYGIGHNTSCTWENCEDDNYSPQWVSSTFLPQFNVRSQSADISNIDKKLLEIRQFSAYNSDKDIIIQNLEKLVTAYAEWIEDEEIYAETLGKHDRSLAAENIKKCRAIQIRMQNGMELLKNNDNAFRAFQLANSAIYLQMFQNQWHFNRQKDGFEAFERREKAQHSYEEYATGEYPEPSRIPSWRPFQLAFILQCLPSFIDENSEDRDLVDLLYFPTGGGKTEAYLALSAFLIFWRRLQYPDSYGGVNIIIRYTLRLLSAQQFERATKLILACEFIRRNHTDLGSEQITIGFWVGGSTIPNTINKPERGGNATDKLAKTQERLNNNQTSINPFQLSNCQWCNTKIIGRTQANTNSSIGHRISRNQLNSYCLNPNCAYSEQNNGLPIVLVDEDIYSNPPTMLFATVDKFAQLAWKDSATKLFNHDCNRKPELIIQDELHLLSGTLGSLVGLFENVILSLCTTETQRPKIIVSTATVKNVEEQVKGLYGRLVQIFPQNATHSDDTFFSKTVLESRRRYIGILPTGKTQTMTTLRLNAALLFARLELWRDSADKTDADQFWTILSYFKSLKHVGRFSNKITAELVPEIKQLQVRYLMNIPPYDNNYSKLRSKNLELTSRIRNERIKKNLDKLDIQFNGDLETCKSCDIVLATNMISVGLDVGRLGIMLMNGMPLNTAEYIQASSRVARKDEGIVFSLFDPNNTRDLSYFEDFIQFHKTFYKQVEPISVTPFAENALDKMLFTSMVAYFRHKMGYASNNMASALIADNNKQLFEDGLKQIFVNHSFADEDDKQALWAEIKKLITAWEYKIQGSPPKGLFYYGGSQETQTKKNLMKPIQERRNSEDKLIGMQSMRSVEPSVIIKINRS